MRRFIGGLQSSGGSFSNGVLSRFEDDWETDGGDWSVIGAAKARLIVGEGDGVDGSTVRDGGSLLFVSRRSSFSSPPSWECDICDSRT